MTVDLSTKPVLPQKVREYGDYRTDDYRYTSSLDRALDDNNSLSNDKKDTLDSLKPPSSGLGTSDVLLPSKKRRGLLSCFRRRKTPPMLSRVSRQCSYCDAWYTDSQNYKGACRRPPSGCRSLTCLRSCVGSRHSPMRVKSTRIVSWPVPLPRAMPGRTLTLHVTLTSGTHAHRLIDAAPRRR